MGAFPPCVLPPTACIAWSWLGITLELCKMHLPPRPACAAQGTGKTTAAGKLALFLKKKGLKVLLVATDVYRPGGQQ